MTNHKKIRPNYEAWYAHVEAWRINVEPLETRLSDFLNHTVGYAQLGLRSAFLLNGGGLIAAPTFAELLGSIWSRGQLPALTMFGAFVAGLILAGGSTLFAFFEFRAGQGILYREIHRTKMYLDRIYNKILREEPIADEENIETKAEKDILRRSRVYDMIAIVCGVGSLVLFVIGAGIGFYILSGISATASIPSTGP